MITIKMVVLVLALIAYGDGCFAYFDGRTERAFLLFATCIALLLARIVMEGYYALHL